MRDTRTTKPHHLQDDRHLRHKYRRGALATAPARVAVMEMGLDPMLRMNDVEALTGLGASAIYRLMHLGTFPKSVPLTPHGRARGWRLSTISTWLNARLDDCA
jgi:prophage regulatory protein